MTEDMLRTVLDTASVTTDPEGWLRLPEGQLLTLYVAHDGVSLNIAKVESLRIAHGVIRARSIKGESFFVAREDLFAVSVDGGTKLAAGRKAGFLG
ncbi:MULTISPECIES: hypothetical protein [Polyangium]|uniref:Uncharacterized protein n=2 Tax=Polyangium TaxID=55 RepID=A0A4U1JI06_9BACT|nr:MULTISPECIES: hypothetical protein [Polyangium]MDI1433549.1 hypothetical protein [Polyangium sorediatum]TKD12093.1 hypothetical protein E8A74_05650 [Polyangium fumosum]